MKGESGTDNYVPGPKGDIGNPGQPVCLYFYKEYYLFWASVP